MINLAENSENKMNLIPKYNFIGYSNLNFYKILSKNDEAVLRQSSKIFQSYSPLYKQNSDITGASENSRYRSDNELENEENLIKCLIFEDIQNTFSEDIKFNGNVIGKIEGLIEIKKIPLIKQILCGIHTENGFDISSIYLHNIPSIGSPERRASNRDVPSELKSFISLKTNLIDKFFPSTLKYLEENKSPKDNNEVEEGKIASMLISETKRRPNSPKNLNIDAKETLNILNDIKTTLKKSCKESVLIYHLVSKEDIIIAQKEMIDLGKNLINILTKEDLIDTRRTLVFDILILLFNRAEIDLRLMFIDKINDISVEKLEVCRDFIEFLNKTLYYCLEKLAAGKSADSDTNEFVEFFLSVSFFRLPIFRKAFINTINQGISEIESKEIFRILDKESETNGLGNNSTSNSNLMDMSGLNLQNTEGNLENRENSDLGANKQKTNDQEDQAIDINPVNTLLDWETLFYNRIEKLSKSESMSPTYSKEIQEIFDKERETEKIINQLEWKGRISKRGNAFFSMIIRLEKYIQSKVVILRNLRWTQIPGFKYIINAIIHELRKREVSQFQEPLVKLLSIFINDSDISNLFINTIIRRTKYLFFFIKKNIKL